MIPTSTPVSDLLRAPIPDAQANQAAGRQPVRILLCGGSAGVDHVVHQLHLLSFAEAGDWSPPLPSPIAGEVIRILTRYLKL